MERLDDRRRWRRLGHREMPRHVPGPAQRPDRQAELPKGPYFITAFGNVSCKQASAQFTSFLDNDYTGALPRPWTLQVSERPVQQGELPQRVPGEAGALRRRVPTVPGTGIRLGPWMR